jgi:hypothetical protein
MSAAMMEVGTLTAGDRWTGHCQGIVLRRYPFAIGEPVAYYPSGTPKSVEFKKNGTIRIF